MFIRRWTTFWRPPCRRLYSGLVLISYLAAVFGLPLPMPVATPAGQTLAVSGGSCRCAAVDQCQGACCCATRVDGSSGSCDGNVKAPAPGRQLAAEEQEQPTASTETKVDPVAEPARECCARKHASKTKSAASTPRGSAGDREAKTCCGKPSHPPADSSMAALGKSTVASAPRPLSKQAPRTTAASGTQVQWVLTISTQRCSGLYTLWVTCGAAVPVPAAVSYHHFLRPIGWVASPTSKALRLPPIALEPPPRTHAAV